MHRSADQPARVLLVALGLLAMSVPVYVLLPLSADRHQALYLVIATTAVLIGFLGLRLNRPPRRRGWFLLLLGAAGWVGGDLFWTLEQYLLPDRYPAPSDALYLGSYLALGAGALVFVSARSGGRDVSAILDALIVATGAGVLVGVFLIAPLAADSTLSLGAKVISSAYPLADIFLLGVVARMYSAAGARTASYRLLTASLTATLIADTGYEVAALASDDSSSPGWTDGAWLIGYLLLAAAVCVPSMKDVDVADPDRIGPSRPAAGWSRWPAG
jgi:hypothetical protein